MTATRRLINPRKLLHSKWTAVTPANREKHFLVTRVLPATQAGSPDSTSEIVAIELEAVHSRRSAILPWRELCDTGRWCQGWV